jgi:hypothetical protein
MGTVSKRSKSSKGPQQTRTRITAPFAVTSDGQLLINVAECDGRSLEGRVLFTGVVMSKGEAARARKVVSDAVFDASSQIAARMPPRKAAGKRRLKARPASKPKARASGRKGGSANDGGEAS